MKKLLLPVVLLALAFAATLTICTVRAQDEGPAPALPELGQPVSEMSLDRLKAAAEGGDAEAQNKLGEHYLEVEYDYTEAAKWFRLAAAQGNAAAQYHMGDNDLNGWDRTDEMGEWDEIGAYTKAVEWYTLSAEQGYAPAQLALGWHCRFGIGTGQSFAEAVKWFHRAALQGHRSARRWLGDYYFLAVQSNVTYDPDKEIAWYREGAGQGSVDALLTLGWRCYDGDGVERDRKEAVRLFRLAAEQGSAVAEFALYCCYAEGAAGVAKNEAEAGKWYRAAVETPGSEVLAGTQWGEGLVFGKNNRIEGGSYVYDPETGGGALRLEGKGAFGFTMQEMYDGEKYIVVRRWNNGEDEVFLADEAY